MPKCGANPKKQESPNHSPGLHRELLLEGLPPPTADFPSSAHTGDTFLTLCISSSPDDKVNNVHLPSHSPFQGSKETHHTTHSEAGVRSSLFPPLTLLSFTARQAQGDCPTTDPLKPKEVNAEICKHQLTGRCTMFPPAVRAEVI